MNIDFANLQIAFKEQEFEINRASLYLTSSARYNLGAETADASDNNTKSLYQ